MDIHSLVLKATDLKKDGQLEDALELFSQAFNLLVVEAIEFSRDFEEYIEDENGEKQLSDDYFEKAKEYFRKDDTACRISNNMGAIFAEMGNLRAAKDMLHQAIDLTPKDYVYEDPYDSLELIESIEENTQRH